jgi:hypothetical protein
MIKEPESNDNHSDNFIFTGYPLPCKQTMYPARSIMTREKIMGASTGPIQGRGMRNKISHVNKEGGQFISTFNPT